MTESAARHLSDADLLRHLDEEGTASERSARDAHLHSCSACASGMRRLEAESVRVSEWLARYDTALADRTTPFRLPARAPRRRVPVWLRAAAVLLLLVAAPVVALPAVRAWIVARVADITATAERTPAAAEPAVQIVRFEPTAGVFAVRFATTERGGTLAVRWRRDGAAPADIDAAGGVDAVLSAPRGVEPVVSASVLRLRNDGSADGRYTLELPWSVTRVDVRVGSRSLELERGAMAGDHVVPLDGGGDGASP